MIRRWRISQGIARVRETHFPKASRARGNALRCGTAPGVLVGVHFLGSSRAREKLFSGAIARVRGRIQHFPSTTRARDLGFTEGPGR